MVPVVEFIVSQSDRPDVACVHLREDLRKCTASGHPAARSHNFVLHRHEPQKSLCVSSGHIDVRTDPTNCFDVRPLKGVLRQALHSHQLLRLANPSWETSPSRDPHLRAGFRTSILRKRLFRRRCMTRGHLGCVAIHLRIYHVSEPMGAGY